MPNNVDERIVRMQFDNSRFEKNVKESLSTIDKLKKALKLDKAAEGFDSIEKAANHISFKGLNDGISQVHANFSLLDVTVLKIFDRIADSAVTLGKNIVKALAVDPITTGFQEYETKMNSIQVIAANTGALNQDAADSAKSMAESLEAVNKIWFGPNVYGNGQARVDALAAAGLDYGTVQSMVNKLANGTAKSMDDFNDEIAKSSGTTVEHIEEVLDNLNLYADKTIYNFTQMTQAIGQFTTAGIDVDTSARSVKGIANLAAYVGAPASDASRSMFQLSQALATGRVRLQDWMSLEHTAGMGGKTFQDALKATAEHLMEVDDSYRAVIEDAGYGSIDELIMDQGSFRESLAQNWLTTDVLSETLAKFAGDFDEAYWKDLGYSDEAVKEIMDLGAVATDAATKVRTFTQMWDALKEAAQSGWTETWQYIVGGFTDAPKLWTAINNAITGIIDPFNNARNEALKFWYSAKIGGRSTWFDAIEKTNFVLDENGEKIAKVNDDGEVLKDTYGNIVYETEKVTEYSGILVDVWDSLAEIVEPIKEAFNEVFPMNLRRSLLDFTLKVKDMTTQLYISDKHLPTIKAAFTAIFKVVKIGLTVFKGFAKVAGSVIKAVITIADKLFTVTDAMVGTEDETDKLGIVMDTIGGIFDNVAGFVENLADKFEASETVINIVKGLWDGLVGGFRIGLAIFEAVGKVFGRLIEKILPAGSAFGDAAEGAMDFVKNTMDVETIIGWIDGAADSINNFIDNFGANFQKVTGVFAEWVKETTGVDLGAVWDWMLGLVDNVKSSLTDMGGINFDNIKELFAGLKDSSPMISNLMDFVDKLKTGADTANSIPDKLTEAKKQVKGIKTEVNGIKSFGLTSIFSGVGDKFSEALDNLSIGDLAGAATSIGLALTVIEGFTAVQNFSKITKGLLDIKTGIVDTITAVGDAFGDVRKFMKSQMIINVALAIGILALALTALAYVPEDKLGRALGTIIVLFTTLRSVMTGLMKTVAMLSIKSVGGTMLAIAASILMVVGAIAILGSMETDKLGPGLAAIYVIMGAFRFLFKSLADMPLQNMENIGNNIFKIALAVGGLILAVGYLGKLSAKGADLTSATIVVGAMMSMVLALIYALNKLPEGRLAGIGGTILLIAVAIDIMVAGFAGLVTAASLAKPGAVNDAIKSMAAIMIGVLAMLGVMTLMMAKAKTTKIGGVSLVMMAISGAILAMVGAIAILTKLHKNSNGNVDKAFITLLELSGLVAGFLLLAAACATFGGRISGLIVMGSLIGIITATMYAFVGLVASLSQIDKTELDNGVETLQNVAIIVGVLIGALIVLSNLTSARGKGLKVNLALNISSFAVNFLIFAGALLATAAAVWVFVDAAQKLYKLVQQIGDGGGDVFVNFFNSLFNKEVLDAGMTAFLNFMDALIVNVPTILDKIGKLIGVITMGTINLLAPFVVSVLAGLAGVLKQINEEALAPVLVELVRVIGLLIDGTGKAIEENEDALSDAVVHLLSALWNLLVATLSKLWMKWEESDAYKALENFGAWVYDALHGVWEWIKSAIASAGEWLEKAFTLIGALIGGATFAWWLKIYAAAVNIYNTIVSAITEAYDWIVNKIDNLVSDIRDKIEDFKNAGKDLIHGFFLGFTDEDEASKMTDAVSSFVDGIKNIIVGPLGFIIKSPSHWAEEQGQMVMEGFKKGVEESGPEAEASVSNVKDNMKAQVEDMRNNTQSLFDQKFKMPEIDTSAFTESMAQLPQPEIDTSNMYNFADVLSQYEAEENPTMTITPVLDMDNLQYEDYAGGYDFGSMFGDSTSAFSLDTTNSLANMDAYDFESMMAENQPEPYDDTNVINAITQLNERLDEMARGFADTDVRLDTGVLVGELVGPMDQALGQRATRTRRGG